MENIKEGKESDIDGDKLISVFFFFTNFFLIYKGTTYKADAQRHKGTEPTRKWESERHENYSYGEIFLPSGFTALLWE